MTSASTVSPRYSSGKSWANTASARASTNRNPEVGSDRATPVSRLSTPASRRIAQRRGPRST